ncbi:hypothetical protein A6723_014035 [Pseudomonas sp. AU11447]|nr:hypothetical protein A6723_014035 [Pseudomonas sp. AU11447]
MAADRRGDRPILCLPRDSGALAGERSGMPGSFFVGIKKAGLWAAFLLIILLIFKVFMYEACL